MYVYVVRTDFYCCSLTSSLLEVRIIIISYHRVPRYIPCVLIALKFRLHPNDIYSMIRYCLVKPGKFFVEGIDNNESPVVKCPDVGRYSKIPFVLSLVALCSYYVNNMSIRKVKAKEMIRLGLLFGRFLFYSVN